jgi:hypothetical protein
MHIVSTQGVLLYLFFDLFGNWELKSLIHPVTFILILISFLLKYKLLKVKIEDLVIAAYSIILICTLLINVNSFFSFYISIREVFFVFILTYLLSQFSFSSRQYKILCKLILILIIINLFFVGLTFFYGPEQFMKLITGRYQWGVDEVTNFQISNFMDQFWRSPGAVGSSGALAYFALLSYFIFDFKRNHRLKKFLAVILLLMTFTRSAMIALLIYEILKYINNPKNINLLQKYGQVILGFVIISFFLLNQTKLLSTESLIIRIEVWLTDISVNYNLLFGGKMGEVGGAIRGQGPEAILDSYWLFLLYSTGLIGIGIWLYYFYQKSKVSKRKFFMVLGLVASGFFVLLSQALPFLVMFPFLFSDYANVNRNQE